MVGVRFPEGLWHFSITTTIVTAAKIDIGSLCAYSESQLRSEGRDSSVNIVSSVNIATELLAGQVENICSILDRDRMLCLRHRPDRFRLWPQVWQILVSHKNDIAKYTLNKSWMCSRDRSKWWWVRIWKETVASRTLQSECNVNTPMIVSPKPLKFLQKFEAHTSPFDVRFLHRPHHFADNSTTWKTHTQSFSVRS
jgi:hypothetical protein